MRHKTLYSCGGGTFGAHFVAACAHFASSVRSSRAQGTTESASRHLGGRATPAALHCLAGPSGSDMILLFSAPRPVGRLLFRDSMPPVASSCDTAPMLFISPSGDATLVDMPISQRRAGCFVAAPLSLMAFPVVVSGTTRSRRRSSDRHSWPEHHMPNSHVLSSCSCSPLFSFPYRRTRSYGTPRVISVQSPRSDSFDGKTHDSGNAASSTSVVCCARPPL